MKRENGLLIPVKVLRPCPSPKHSKIVHEQVLHGRFVTTTEDDWYRYRYLYLLRHWDGKTPGDIWRPKPYTSHDEDSIQSPGVRIYKEDTLVFETTKADWYHHWDVYHSKEWDGETHAALWQPPAGTEEWGDWSPPPWRSPFECSREGESPAELDRLSLASTDCGSTTPVPEEGRNVNFFGRARELKDLTSHLLPSQSHSSMLYFVVCGMRGIGKTELAREWFYSNAKSFSEAFWVDASGAFQLDLGFDSIARMLGLIQRSNVNFSASRELAKDWFVKAETPWLICFDGASDMALLETYLPQKGMGSVLITSQNHPGRTISVPNMRHMELKPFWDQEGSETALESTSYNPLELHSEEPPEQAAERSET